MSDQAHAADLRVIAGPAGDLTVVVRIAGHALRAGGQGFLPVDCYTGRCATNLRGTTHEANRTGESVGGPGHGLCSCGALSPHLANGRQRRRWHRRHKARVLLGQPEPEGQPSPVSPTDVA